MLKNELTLSCRFLPQHVQVHRWRGGAAWADISGHLQQPSDLGRLL